MKNRRSELIKHTKKIKCDTLITFEPENLFYLTNFWGEAVGILDKNAHATIIVPKLEASRAKKESINTTVISSDRGSELILDLAKKLEGKKACTDCQNYQVMQSLKKSIPTIKHSTEPFDNSRLIKDSGEITILKKASRIIDELFELCAQKISKGQKESELQAILMSYAIERGMFDTGYKSTLNPLIIAGGPNGAMPHAQVTNRKFVNGDLIIIDLTLRYKGYVSDSTRTFGLGNVSNHKKNVYEIVKESQRLGLKVSRPNVACKSVDDACRDYIEKNNYGKYFIHSTGHGIGLNVHESPTLSFASKRKLLANMAITVEPGIYVPDKFGIRIEDSLIVNKKPIVMHKFTKDLIIL